MDKRKKIILLGATGSIGKSALRLIRSNPNLYKLIGVSAHNNAKLLSKIVREFDVPNIVLSHNKNFKSYSGKYELNIGSSALMDLAKIKCDIVISGISGVAGLHSAYAAVNSGNNLAIANKETLVAAGKIFIDKSFEKGVNILPIDSEHSAIFQCLNKNNLSSLDYITLTASGGPFLNTPLKQFENIKPSHALKHPIWKMGKKISVDSSTMINKALEIIEASVLFNLESEKIEVIVHPQHIIHGLVHYKDGSTIANMGLPDMITPLSVALEWPNRVELNIKKMSLSDISTLNFYKPDFIKFPGLKLGWEALQNPNFSPIVLNASNEIAVDNFLRNKIKYTDIYNVIYETLNKYNPTKPKNIDDVIEINNSARLKAQDFIERIT